MTIRTEDDKELSRIHCFLQVAVKQSGIDIGAGDVARLAMSFRNALHDDNACVVFRSVLDAAVHAMEADAK